MKTIEIPENITEFLHWFKDRTEQFWSKTAAPSPEAYVCEDWIVGAKWIGMTDEQIDQVELKYGIQFMPEHREFLRILHTIDRKQPYEYTESFDEDAEVLIKHLPFFYNWLEDHDEIVERLNWPARTIFEDVVGRNSVWLRSWGSLPGTVDEKKRIFDAWIAQAPKLVPLTGHRFLVSDVPLPLRPVLSVWGSDIIVYGWTLRTYLLHELAHHLDMMVLVNDSEDQCSYWDNGKELASVFHDDRKYDERKTLPYWEEMIMFWSSGWSSFGLNFPEPNKEGPYPIVKTFFAGDEEGQQKRFNSF